MDRKSLSLSPPWEFQTPNSLMTPRLLINLSKNWLSYYHFQFSSVQSLNRVWFFVTPWITARQASLSFTNSRSSLKLMSIESAIQPSHPLSSPSPPAPPSIRVFSIESSLHMRWPKYWNFTLASVLPMNTQDWFPLGWTGWISLQSKGRSRVFSNTTVQKHHFFGAYLSL